jgi:hypothetical protein
MEDESIIGIKKDKMMKQMAFCGNKKQFVQQVLKM